MTERPTRIYEVESVNHAEDIGDRVARYDEIRCPNCNRMFWCIRWADYGYPEVHCENCNIRESWPFEGIDGLKDQYEALGREI
jgi:DNA-directed RNA polymerase subunit RPC12/RpoP